MLRWFFVCGFLVKQNNFNFKMVHHIWGDQEVRSPDA